MDADESARLHALEGNYNRSLGRMEQQLRQLHRDHAEQKDWLITQSTRINTLERQVAGHLGGHRAITTILVVGVPIITVLANFITGGAT